MTATLADWERNGWLSACSPTPEGVQALLGVAQRDLENCRAQGLDADWRLNIAYNAALQTAAAALEASGYRAARESHHYRVIESLRLTIGAKDDLVLPIDRLRQKRNIGIYERAGQVSDKEADAAYDFAKRLKSEVDAWLHSEHPDLLPH